MLRNFSAFFALLTLFSPLNQNATLIYCVNV